MKAEQYRDFDATESVFKKYPKISGIIHFAASKGQVCPEAGHCAPRHVQVEGSSEEW